MRDYDANAEIGHMLQAGATVAVAVGIAELVLPGRHLTGYCQVFDATFSLN